MGIQQTAENPSIQVMEIQDLFDEIENRVILKEIEQKINSGFHNFVFDLKKLNFVNSVGINFLIAALRKSEQAGGKLALANSSPQIQKLLEITRLKPFFSLQPSVSDALQAIKG